MRRLRRLPVCVSVDGAERGVRAGSQRRALARAERGERAERERERERERESERAREREREETGARGEGAERAEGLKFPTRCLSARALSACARTPGWVRVGTGGAGTLHLFSLPLSPALSSPQGREASPPARPRGCHQTGKRPGSPHACLLTASPFSLTSSRPPPPALCPSPAPPTPHARVLSFSTHGQQSAAKGSSATVSRCDIRDIRLIQYMDSSALGLVRRWRSIGYFPIHVFYFPRHDSGGQPQSQPAHNQWSSWYPLHRQQE
jgi:hypothetical protein